MIAIAGDGSIMMNLQEMQTIAGYGLPVKVILINNSGYVSIFQTQRNFFNGVEVGGGPKSNVTFPDFGKIAAAFGFAYVRTDTHAGLADAIAATLAADGPAFCEIVVDEHVPFAPKLGAKTASRRADHLARARGSVTLPAARDTGGEYAHRADGRGLIAMTGRIVPLGRPLRFLVAGGLNTAVRARLLSRAFMVGAVVPHALYDRAGDRAGGVPLFRLHDLQARRVPHPRNILREFATFASFYLFNYAANWAALPLLVEIAGISPIIAQLGFTVVLVVGSWFWHNRVTFRRPEERT